MVSRMTWRVLQSPAAHVLLDGLVIVAAVYFLVFLWTSLDRRYTKAQKEARLIATRLIATLARVQVVMNASQHCRSCASVVHADVGAACTCWYGKIEKALRG